MEKGNCSIDRSEKLELEIGLEMNPESHSIKNSISHITLIDIDSLK